MCILYSPMTVGHVTRLYPQHVLQWDTRHVCILDYEIPVGEVTRVYLLLSYDSGTRDTCVSSTLL